MTKWNTRVTMIVTALAIGVAGSSALQAAVVSLNPAATYLHTLNPTSPGTGGAYNDSAPNSTPVDLAALGIFPGQLIRLTRLGDYQGQSSGADNLLSLVAVFSSSNAISSDHTLVDRIPGAIEAGVDFVTNNNAISGESTDITQDFLVASSNGTQTSVQIVVPAGGAYLFFTVADSYFADNKDLDNDFGVSIAAIPEPASAAMLAVGAVALMRRRR